jgi:hypothetical protein
MEVINETHNELGRMPAIAPTYWLTRFVILRLLGLIYTIAILVAINQVVPLIGSHGLTPVGIYLKRVSAALGSDAPASCACLRSFGSGILTQPF